MIKRDETLAVAYEEFDADLNCGAANVKLLEQDVSLLDHKFFSKFPHIEGMGARLGDNNNWIIFENFPIPPVAEIKGKKITYPQPFDDFLIIVHDYPLFPPRGAHFHKHSPNAEVYKEHTLKDHNFASVVGTEGEYKKRVDGAHKQGWLWGCFHYKNFKWKYNSRDIASGQNLCEYMTLLHHRLGGLEIE